jgi:uncharacterized ion transporter superfamily protein YfcC
MKKILIIVLFVASLVCGESEEEDAIDAFVLAAEATCPGHADAALLMAKTSLLITEAKDLEKTILQDLATAIKHLKNAPGVQCDLSNITNMLDDVGLQDKSSQLI